MKYEVNEWRHERKVKRNTEGNKLTCNRAA